MRISDWSSDVCSSDLGKPSVFAVFTKSGRTIPPDCARQQIFTLVIIIDAGDLGQQGKTGCIAIAGTDGGCGIDPLHLIAREIGTRYRIAFGIKLLRGVKIGRTSSRKRVCKYV